MVLAIFLLFFFQFSKIILVLFPLFQNKSRNNFRSFDFFVMCCACGRAKTSRKNENFSAFVLENVEKETKLFSKTGKRTTKTIARNINFCSSFFYKNKKMKQRTPCSTILACSFGKIFKNLRYKEQFQFQTL